MANLAILNGSKSITHNHNKIDKNSHKNLIQTLKKQTKTHKTTNSKNRKATEKGLHKIVKTFLHYYNTLQIVVERCLFVRFHL